jgi:hypothetical protein
VLALSAYRESFPFPFLLLWYRHDALED